MLLSLLFHINENLMEYNLDYVMYLNTNFYPSNRKIKSLTKLSYESFV